MKKILLIMILIIIAIMAIILPMKTKANFSISEADLYSKGVYSNYLHYGNMGIVFNYVVYAKDGVEYPAYCLNKDVDGVTKESAYSVSTNELLTNVKVWRAIINGYPYKTPEALGCGTKEEAYIATKQAVYCMLYDRDVNEYKAFDEREERVLNALTNIVTNARNSNEIKQSPNLTINDVTQNWQVDNIEKNYISKTYTVSANANINNYYIELENNNLEGIKITDEQNNEKNEFTYGENFKILLPINAMQNEGSFEIKVNGQVATKPVLYGYSQDRNKQDYAITGSLFEDGTGTRTVYYTENETKVIIKKINDEEQPLEGVKFNLLDENKNIIYSDLTTNINGEAIVNNLMPGKYFVEETSTLNGYKTYEELIEINIEYNETFTVTVKNSKEKVTIEKPESIEKEMEVVVKLPKTGM